MLYQNLSINEQGHLTFADYDTVALSAQYGTPLMVMDESVIRSRCRTYLQAMKAYLPAGSCPSYASKALSMKRIYQIISEEGMHIDVVSPGELYTAVQAGFPMEEAYFHGNSKSDQDIAFAMDNHIGWFVCDNMDELQAIDRLAQERNIRQKLLLRFQPGIDPHTHAKISTGNVDCKFGAAIETGQAEELILQALSLPNVDLRGYHCHIGSQIFEAGPFCDAAAMMLSFVAYIERKHGYHPQYLNVGGGMGVPYVASEPKVDYEANIRLIGQCVKSNCEQLGIEPPAILMEPGRSIVADAGMTLYTVSSIKQIPGYKNYVAVDGGMTDNPRYTLYQADYTIMLANKAGEKADFLCTVAGRCCESGDILQENVLLQKPVRNDILAVLTTGAYNYSMASNYNRVQRPPIVMIGKSGPYIAVRRETLADMLICDM